MTNSVGDSGASKTGPVPKPSKFRPTAEISVYGGHLSSVQDSVQSNLIDPGEASMYRTWVNIRATKTLTSMIGGGVESAGGLIEIIWMFIVLAVIIFVFFIWQLVVFFLVIGVLAVFSGGAALKYVRGTYVSLPVEKTSVEKLDAFAADLIAKGQFVGIKFTNQKTSLGPIGRSSNRATRLFRLGIHLSLFVATAFLVFEIVYRYFRFAWMTDIMALGGFGVAFLAGIVMIDAGALARRRLAGRLKARGRSADKT